MEELRMQKQFFYSKTLNEIKRKIDSFDYISFDLFDTLVTRPFAQPTDLFLYIEKQYGASGFFKARLAAGAIANRNILEEEVTLDEIYYAMDEKFLKYKEVERNLEIKLSKANNTAKTLFEYAKSKNKKICIISDMYLDEDTINKILKKNGYDSYKLFLSSSYRLKKESGNLFYIAISTLGIKENQLLHIGDNEFADYKVPKKFGISSQLLPSNLSIFLKSNKSIANFYYSQMSNIEVSILIAVCSQSFGEINSSNYWEHFGYTYAGPVISAYAQWLRQALQNRNFTSVAFVARDGYTLEKVFNHITNNKYKTTYIYANRRIKLLLDLDYYNYKIWEDVYTSAVNSILDFYCITNKKSIFLNGPRSFEEKVDYLQNNISSIRKCSESYKKHYISYLEKKISGNKIALIDGSTGHFSAQLLLSKLLPKKDIKGFYYFREVLTNSYEKYLDIKHSAFQNERENIYINWDFMEFILCSPEYPVGFFFNNSPVYEKCKYDDYRCKIYPELSNSAFKFGVVFDEYFNDENFLLSADVIADYINHFCSHLSKIDSKYLSNIYQIFSNDSVRSIIYKANTSNSLKLSIKKIVYKCNRISVKIFGKKIFYKKYKGKKICYYFMFLPLITREEI